MSPTLALPGEVRRTWGSEMNRLGLFVALVLAAGAIGCSSTPKPSLAQTAPAGNPAAQNAGSGVVPAGFQTRISTFDSGKDCKT